MLPRGNVPVPRGGTKRPGSMLVSEEQLNEVDMTAEERKIIEEGLAKQTTRAHLRGQKHGEEELQSGGQDLPGEEYHHSSPGEELPAGLEGLQSILPGEMHAHEDLEAGGRSGSTLPGSPLLQRCDVVEWNDPDGKHQVPSRQIGRAHV